MGQIREELSVGLGQLNAQLQQADQMGLAADRHVTATHRRVEFLIKRIEDAKASALNLERIFGRLETGAIKRVGKAAGAAVVGASVSALGIPEVAQPIVHFGTALALGGPAGLGLAAISWLIGEAKAVSERQEKLKADHLQWVQRQNEIIEDLRLRQAKLERDFQLRIEEAALEAQEDFKKFYDEARLANVDDAF